MPTIAVTCRYCGAEASRAVGQVAFGGELQWWASTFCPACGARTEADGGDDMPDRYRAALMEEEGRWSVVTEGSPSVALLRAARECLGLSIGEVPALKARLPGVLATGTRSEMDVLASRLRRIAGGAEIPVRVAAAEPGAAPDPQAR